jgi:ATP-dependent Clp protease ATP-binding subunit ClpC
MYEHFTDRARKVLQLANEEARRLKHEYIGTEHILLGLVKEGSGVAANVLRNLEVNPRRIRLEIEKIVMAGPDSVHLGKLPQTPRAKRVIEFAIDEAHGMNHQYVGTEHLLLGLIREEEGIARQVLINLGLNLDKIRDEVLLVLGMTPDRAVLIDEAPETADLSPEIAKAVKQLTELIQFFRNLKEDAIASQDFERATHMRDQEDRLKKVREFLLRDRRGKPRNEPEQESP